MWNHARKTSLDGIERDEAAVMGFVKCIQIDPFSREFVELLTKGKAINKRSNIVIVTLKIHLYLGNKLHQYLLKNPYLCCHYPLTLMN